MSKRTPTERQALAYRIRRLRTLYRHARKRHGPTAGIWALLNEAVTRNLQLARAR